MELPLALELSTMVIIDDPVDPGTQVEPQSGDTSLPQTSSPAPINHSDPATALEILKRDFHAFREQTAKERAETEAYRVRIAELEKEQFLLRATLEHRTVYNDSLDRAARIAGTPDSLQGQTGSILPGGPSQIVYMSHPLTHPSFPLPAPQPSILNDSPLPHQPNPSAPPISTSTTANSPNPPLDMPTRLLLQLSQTVTQLASRVEGVESRGAQRPLFSGYGHCPSPFTPRVQMEKRPPGAKPFKMDKYKGTGDPHLHLETFFSLCSSSGYSDAIACHAFQETLSEEA